MINRDAWRGGRVVECARLEIECGESHREFESPPLRLVLTPQNLNIFLPQAVGGWAHSFRAIDLLDWAAPADDRCG